MTHGGGEVTAPRFMLEKIVGGLVGGQHPAFAIKQQHRVGQGVEDGRGDHRIHRLGRGACGLLFTAAHPQAVSGQNKGSNRERRPRLDMAEQHQPGQSGEGRQRKQPGANNGFQSVHGAGLYHVDRPNK